MTTFSERHGYSPEDAEITIRQDAPEWLRSVVVDLAYDAGKRPGSLRGWLCKTLYETPDPSNWSEYPNIDMEVRGYMNSMPWYHVYDFIEWVYVETQSKEFSESINKAFRRKGVGWQLTDGQIQIRGPEIFEKTVRAAIDLSHESNRAVAKYELTEALRDLSKRPNPEITGAIQHGMAALECIAKSVTNEEKGTLGDWIKRHRSLLPAPLDVATEKLWGFASENGRHVKEGSLPSYEEAELIVGVCGSLAVYLLRKGDHLSSK